jgi:hypothetical protein
MYVGGISLAPEIRSASSTTAQYADDLIHEICFDAFRIINALRKINTKTTEVLDSIQALLCMRSGNLDAITQKLKTFAKDVAEGDDPSGTYRQYLGVCFTRKEELNILLLNIYLMQTIYQDTLKNISKSYSIVEIYIWTAMA